MGKKLRKVYLIPVRIYQKFISPAIGKNCIYTPSCSAYFILAVEKHGIIKGTVLGISRILRCNRFFLGGYDPVPEKFNGESLRNPRIFFRRRIRRQK